MYGYIRDEIQQEDYVLGGGHIPQKETLVEDGDWTRYLPLFERQAKNFETAGCTVFGTLNALEMLFYRLTGKESNYSDRFLYILAGIRPPGGSAHKVAEVIRDNGLILEDKLPMTKTFEEYITPDPIPVDLLIEGQHFLNSWEMKHEFLWRDMQDSNKKEKIKEALKYSPVGVSVHAWKKQGKIYTKSTFDDDNHWCVCFKVDDEGYYHIFDTYDNDVKILSPDYDFEIAKVYFLFARTTPRKPTQGIIKGILKTLISLYKHLYEVVKAEEEKEAVEKPPIKVEEKPVTISNMDKLINAIIMVESGGLDTAIGDKHLKNKAYGPMQIRQPAVTDVNNYLGTNYKAQDCLGNRELSIKIFKAYMEIYCTEKRLGRKVTDEDRARCWNGGPFGYKSKLTEGYWLKVKKYL